MGKLQLRNSRQREEFLRRCGVRSMYGLFESVQVVKCGLNVEAKENMNQIIKDFAHPADKFGFQSFGDGKTLTKLHLHLK